MSNHEDAAGHWCSLSYQMNRSDMNRSDHKRPPEGFTSSQRTVWVAILAIAVAIQAYYTMLTGFSFYDDEGTLMLTVKQYLSGKRLYDEILTVYGPVYYFYNALIRRVTLTSVTHDITRISSLIPWILCTVLCGWIVLRLTRSLVFGAMALTAVSMKISFFKLEPGHPQEITLLLLIALVACPLWLPIEKRRVPLMFSLGVIASALLLVKINIGIYVGAAIALAVLSQAPFTRYYRLLLYTVGLLCAAMPLTVMWNHLEAGWARKYCVCATACILGVTLIVGRSRQRINTGIRDISALACGYVLTIVSTGVILGINKVSPKSVIDSLVFLPARVFARDPNWFIPPDFSSYWCLWASIGLLAALVARRHWGENGLSRRIAIVKLLFTATGFACLLLRLDLVATATPFAWLVLLRPGQIEPDRQTFPRVVLAAVTAMQSLYGYPVYGAQSWFIQILFATLVIVCAADAVEWIAECRTWPERFVRQAHTFAMAALVVILGFNLAIGWHRYRNYSVLPALELPGSHRIHIEQESKATLETISRGIKGSCDAFEALPGLPSFNFWSDKHPVTGLNSDAWTLYLSGDQQRAVVAALSERARPCMIYNPQIAETWNPGHQDLSSMPLVAYMRENFRPLLQAGNYELLVHK